MTIEQVINMKIKINYAPHLLLYKNNQTIYVQFVKKKGKDKEDNMAECQET